MNIYNFQILIENFTLNVQYNSIIIFYRRLFPLFFDFFKLYRRKKYQYYCKGCPLFLERIFIFEIT
jgi:hypothetical protein